jgi:hypothetical protein
MLNTVTGRVVVWYFSRGDFTEASLSFRDFDTAIRSVFGYCDVFTDENESFVVAGRVYSFWNDTRVCRDEVFNFYRADGAHINPVLVAARAAVLEEDRQRRRAVRLSSKGSYEFRSGPVPGIRGFRWGRGRTMRHPATLQERRANDGLTYDDDVLEFGVRVRGRRSAAMLPTVWDDILCGDQYHYSWKRHRRHQWK